MAARKNYYYTVNVLMRKESHWISYNLQTSSYYVTKNNKYAERFLNLRDAVDSFFEFCETHRIKKNPKYVIDAYRFKGMNSEKSNFSDVGPVKP